MSPRCVLLVTVALILVGCDSEFSPTAPQADVAAVDAIELVINGAQAISTGENHSCAIKPDATVVCWGRNKERQLGGGSSTSNRSTPVPVVGLSNVVSVAAGRFHTCAILANGTGRCWGSNFSGQLGNGGAGRGALQWWYRA